MENSPSLQVAQGAVAIPVRDAVPAAGSVAVRKREHMPALDGLRGLAAVLVIFSHLPNRNAFWSQVSFGACGVMLFFVLSGFLMAHLHLHQEFNAGNVRRFCVARMARIVPLYYLVVLAAFVASQLIHHDFHYQMGLVQLVRQLAFVGSISVFWSVGPEFQFYAFFLLLWGIPLLHGRMRSLALASLGLLVVVSYATAPHLPTVLFLSKLHIFLAGVAVAMLRWYLVQRGLPTQATLRVMQALAVGAVVLMLIPYHHMLLPLFPEHAVHEYEKWYFADIPRTALAMLVVLSFSFRSTVSDALLGNAVVRELGRSSFSIYLLHVPVTDVMQTLDLFNRLGPWISTVMCVVASVLVSIIVNRLVEGPAQRWVIRRFSRKQGELPA